MGFSFPSFPNVFGGTPTEVPPELQKVLNWPIKTKGAIERHNPLGDPKLEKYYHEALVDGQLLEKQIGEAQHWLMQKKQWVADKIMHKMDAVKICTDGKLSRRPRAIKYAIDAIGYLNDVNKFMQETIGLIRAITSNIGMLSAMQQNLLGMVQQNLNALANLMNEVCNWGLPDLPAIPNMFSDTVWNWNGFNFFPLAAFKPKVGFDTNFAFNQCHIHIPNLNIFRNYPSSVTTYSGLPYGTPLFVPPLGGLIPNTGTDLSNPDFIHTMQTTNTDPVYGPTFNPRTSMLGSVPDPATIISNYRMPAKTYHDNIVSIVPVLRENVIEPQDADYDNPDMPTRQANLRKDVVHYVTLDEVVKSNFDPNLTAAWLFYVQDAREGRSGIWLSQFEDVYTTYIQPSVNTLASTDVPWNNVLGGPGVSSAPTSIPVINTLKALPEAERKTLLWKLSYVEASLLGYTRSQTWDSFRDTTYLSGVTGTDLDYVPTPVDFTKTSSIVLGLGKAAYPVTCVFPVAMTAMLNKVIAQASADIDHTPTYQSPRLSSRFVYDQFAQASQVDRYTQFWRDFNMNMKAMLAQDVYVVQFVITYFDILNGALNPLANQAAYNSLKADAANRNRTWAPGTPLLAIPKAPVVSYSNDTVPEDGQSGWQGINFDPMTFLSRPDIQAQTIPVQMAMLRTNLSYAGLLQFQTQAVNAIQAQINNAKAFLQSAQQLGFHVSSTTPVAVPVGTSVTLAFDSLDPNLGNYDMTNNVTNPTTFTIQADGEYAIFGSVEWEGVETGQIRTVTIMQNGTPIESQSSDPNFEAPLSIQFATMANVKQGDVIQVLASHTFTTDQTVGAGSFFSMIQAGPTSEPIQLPSTATDSGASFTAGADMPVLTAYAIQSDARIAPIDPTTVVGDSNGVIQNPNVDGVTLELATTDKAISCATTYGSAYQVPGANFTVGGLLYVSANGTLTQDFNSLLTTCQWIICVGRAMASDTFLYEPHIPTRIVNFM